MQDLRITVVTAPSTINVGQMMQVSAIVTDKYGAPIVTPQLYMDIIDSTGRVYWPLSLVETNENGFSKMIATNEMKTNTRYQIRVAINKKLIRKGWAFFKTAKRKGIIPFIPLVFAPAVLMPGNQLIPDAAKTISFVEAQIKLTEIRERLDDMDSDDPFRKQLLDEQRQLRKVKDTPTKKKIFLTYATEKDRRVCPICAPNDGLVFSIDDPGIIKIGPPQLGGATHYGCRCHYNMDIAINPALAKVQRIIRAAKAVIAVKKHLEHEALIIT